MDDWTAQGLCDYGVQATHTTLAASEQVSLQPDIDDISWAWKSSQVYTAAPSYHCQFIGLVPPLRFDKLWKAKVQFLHVAMASG